MTLLIVEDSLLFRQTLRDTIAFRFPSLTVMEAQEGEQAMSMLNNHDIKLVFMDIRLPGRNGIELTREIKHLYPHVIVAMVTHYDSEAYREALFKSGADYFLSKRTASSEDFIELVRKELGVPD